MVYINVSCEFIFNFVKINVKCRLIVHMKVKILIIFVLLCNCMLSRSQSFPQYPNPVKIPVYLSATFAELRSNAFHAGVDIKTQGVEGHEVFSVADGYVSRIGVSPYGYGKVLYITHNDGFTSVYAHLSKFNKEIGEFVKEKQYEDESFSQNIILDKNKFPIKKGDFVGFTGNSGGSGGPHLHYEIRYTNTQEPVNPLYFGLKIKDTMPPCIKGFAIYPLENSTVNACVEPLYLDVASGNDAYILENPIFNVSGYVAFGINVFDQADGSNNKNGPYSIELFADDSLIFSIKSHKYSYSETRYINSLIDYSYYVNEKQRFVRTEIDKFNKLKIYNEKNGVAYVNQGDTLDMKYLVKDYNGNVSELEFTLIGESLCDLKEKRIIPGDSHSILEGKPYEIYLDGFESDIPEYAFYRDVYLNVYQTDTVENICSYYAYIVGCEEIPLHKKITVRIKPKEEFVEDTLLYVASIGKSGRYSFLGNKVSNGFIEAKTNVLGTYALVRDTVAPVIKPINFKSNGIITDNWSLRVAIEDKGCGIKRYAMYVNDEWVLADYDAKNNMLMYQVDNHIKSGYNAVKVVVEDMVGNETVYSTILQR